MDPMAIEFKLTPEESNRAQNWIQKHSCGIRKKPIPQGAIGGRISFTFTNTTIGTIIVVKCACGNELLVNEDL